MNDFVWGAFVISAPLTLLSAGLVPSELANRHVRAMTRAGLSFTLFAFANAVVNVLLLIAHSPLDVSLVTLPGHVSVGVYFDSLTAAMLLLISFIGLVITRFSVRYLSGEETQGRFFRWISFTLGAVSLMVVANNLVLFTFAWMLTSFGLHQLLTHYHDRPQAITAARKKFLISRIGDVMLIIALILTFRLFGSFDYAVIFAAIEQGDKLDTATLAAATMLFGIGAMTKSAQFPFHSWLPDTMETPTPVSALMHAGIINAGGFLVIRLSPLIATSPIALHLLASVGLITALLGALVMLTQTSVKRSLAFSTIAQMGFMMLQCGLGAFSAALLHIIAHSLYKAYAFLSSGTLVGKEAAVLPSLGQISGTSRLFVFLAAASSATAICYSASALARSSTASDSGKLVLCAILTFAITQLLWKSFSALSLRVAAEGLIKAVGLTTAYFFMLGLIDYLVAPALPKSEFQGDNFERALVLMVVCSFGLIFTIQEKVFFGDTTRALRALYVHASHGFYLDVLGNKITRVVWRGIARVQGLVRGPV